MNPAERPEKQLFYLAKSYSKKIAGRGGPANYFWKVPVEKNILGFPISGRRGQSAFDAVDPAECPEGSFSTGLSLLRENSPAIPYLRSFIQEGPAETEFSARFPSLRRTVSRRLKQWILWNAPKANFSTNFIPRKFQGYNGTANYFLDRPCRGKIYISKKHSESAVETLDPAERHGWANGRVFGRRAAH